MSIYDDHSLLCLDRSVIHTIFYVIKLIYVTFEHCNGANMLNIGH